MPIFRVRKNKSHPYTIFDNTSINDKRLSAKAKGILLYLISKPDNWYTNLPNLVSAFTDGTRSIRAGIDELISLGYIVRIHVRKDDGKFAYYDYSVYEIPLKPTIRKTIPKPECRNATLENATLDDSTLLNTNKKEYTDKTTSTPVNNPTLSKFVDVDLNYINKKTEAYRLLSSLKIKNHKKIFDLFKLSTILEYLRWMKERNVNIKNPTGFFITAIKEKWLDDLAADSVASKKLLFYYKCKKCNKVFGYQDPYPDFEFCDQCLKLD